MANDIVAEEWRSVEGFLFYEVSNLGRVKRVVAGRRTFVGKILTFIIDKDGYHRVNLFNGSAKKSLILGVHRLVCVAFNGNAPSSKHQVAHNDGNRQNNVSTNVRWATSKENHADRVAHGTDPKGERANSSKLTEKDVREIRRRAKTGETNWMIARDFDVVAEHIYAIKSRRAWGWLPDEPD